jgi:ABC-type phosphate transport system ATPase subunit
MNDFIPNVRIEGSVLYENQNIYAPNIDPVAVRRHIGMVFQKPNPFPKSVYENVAWVRASTAIRVIWTSWSKKVCDKLRSGTK